MKTVLKSSSVYLERFFRLTFVQLTENGSKSSIRPVWVIFPSLLNFSSFYFFGRKSEFFGRKAGEWDLFNLVVKVKSR